MKTKAIQSGRVLQRLVFLILAIAILVTGYISWPFVVYPVAHLDIQRLAPLTDAPLQRPVAGMAVADITPPMGISKFGYSAWARASDGFRTRLKVRAFYLSGPEAPPMALVAADLGSGSRVLHHRVAELIAGHTNIPAHRLSLLVTHTHSGPGQYLGSDFYNLFGSNTPGFDPQLAEFLSQRIARAVIHAYESRRPARFAIGQMDVRGLTRNRSVQAWARNFDIPGETINEAMAMQAINPTMTLLRIDQQADDGLFYPAGALTAFSIHGTAIPAFTKPWHADLWAWLATDVEHAIQEHYQTPFPVLHGAYQATHADNTPAWHDGLRGDREARRIGKSLARHAFALFQQLDEQMSDELVSAMGSQQIDLLDPSARAFGICERAVAGAATAGGAHGDEVFPVSWIPLIQAGWPRRFFTHGCHGVKHWMFSRLQLLLPATSFPSKALIQTARINNLILVMLPWEITLETGNHIRNQVLAALPRGNWLVEISSLANGMFGYAVTPAEYSLQFYEGGHTLYGPGTMAFLGHHSATLAARVMHEGDVAQLPDSWQFALIAKSRWPQPGTDKDVARQALSAPAFTRGSVDREPYWEFRFRGERPDRIDLAEPLLSIEIRTQDHWQPMQIAGRVVDDSGHDLQIMLLDETDTHADYAVRWHNPLTVDRDTRLRFRVDGLSTQSFPDPVAPVCPFPGSHSCAGTLRSAAFRLPGKSCMLLQAFPVHTRGLPCPATVSIHHPSALLPSILAMSGRPTIFPLLSFKHAQVRFTTML